MGCILGAVRSPLCFEKKLKADSIHASSFYYQHKPKRLPACPLTIHALLHIPDQIRWMGPWWTTWAFPIERQCGYFQRSIQSRQNPYVSMDQHLADLSQLRQIKVLYNLTDEQLGKPLKHPPSQTKRLEDCKSHLGTFAVKVYGLKVRLAQIVPGCSGVGGPSDCEGTLWMAQTMWPGHVTAFDL